MNIPRYFVQYLGITTEININKEGHNTRHKHKQASSCQTDQANKHFPTTKMRMQIRPKQHAWDIYI